jgi:hypothetical protein
LSQILRIKKDGGKDLVSLAKKDVMIMSFADNALRHSYHSRITAKHFKLQMQLGCAAGTKLQWNLGDMAKYEERTRAARAPATVLGSLLLLTVRSAMSCTY